MSNELIFPRKGFAFTATGIDLHGKLIDKKTWMEGIRFFGALIKSTPWMLGDWVNGLEIEPGKSLGDLAESGTERKTVHKGYKYAADMTGFSIEYIKQVAQVCRKLPKAERMLELSFEHYNVLLARIKNPARKKWEVRAIKSGWTASELKDKYESARFDREYQREERSLKDFDKRHPRSTAPLRDDDSGSGLSLEDLKRIANENNIKIFDFLCQAMEMVVEEIDYVLHGRSLKEVKYLYENAVAFEKCLHGQLQATKRG